MEAAGSGAEPAERLNLDIRELKAMEVEQLIEDENAFGRRLWGLLCLELWFQTFIDKN